MKTFPTAFTTEKNKKTGAAPVWILKCTFPSTGTIYLSDQEFNVASWNGGITTLPLVAAWGQIDEDIGGDMAFSRVSDFSLEAINNPNASPNLSAILWTAANNVEVTDCELFLWFRGLDASTDPPQKIWTGNIIDWEEIDELRIRLQMADQSQKIDKYVGGKITLAAYPSADPDDVGKVRNIGYGALREVPCRALKAGAVDTLRDDLTAAATSFYVSAASNVDFPTGTVVVQIDSEQISGTYSQTTKQFTACTRGYGGTTAAGHTKGASVAQVLTEYIYEIFSHPARSITTIRVDGVKQTSGFTAYTGKTGDELTGYAGAAVVKFTALPVVKKQVNLSVSEGSHSHPAAANNIINWDFDAAAGAGSTNPAYCIDGNLETYAGIWEAPITLTKIRAESYNGIPKKIYIAMKAYPQSGSAITFTFAGKSITVYHDLPAPETVNSGWQTLGTAYDTWTELNAATGSLSVDNSGSYNYIYEVWVQIEYEPTVSAGPATGVALSGNSTAETVIGSLVTADAEGHQDDASGTYTGTANALIERPDHVVKHFLYTYAGWATANFYTDAATPFGTAGYKFALLINEYKTLKEWLAAMAFQSRCYFRFYAGQAQLLYRSDSLISDKTITAAMTRMQEDHKTTLRMSRSRLDEVINKIGLHYDRDWTKTGEDAYKQLTATSDAASIAKYGEKERPELFMFDFVTLAAMAANLRDFYLARYKDRKKVVEMELFLDNSELEFADGVTIAAKSNLLCEAQKVNFYPGSGKDLRNDRIALTAREY